MKCPAALLAAVVCGATACTPTQADAPRTPVLIATPNGTIGQALARFYNQHMPGIVASAAPPETSRFNLRALQQHTADVAVVRADLAYAAYGRGTPLYAAPHDRLRGIAVMGMSLLHIVVRADSPVHSLRDLKGKRIGLMSVSADAQARMTREGDLGFFRTLLTSTGAFDRTEIETVALGQSELVEALESRRLAAGAMLTAQPGAALVFDMAGDVGFRLLEIDSATAARMRAQLPFYKPALIPAGTYRGQHASVRTVGVDVLLASHADLPEDVAYGLVSTLFDPTSGLEGRDEIARSFDSLLASATPIPLHPGAARYYRERELPHY
jgi:TRAP transporter TAXI family solute receptor